MKRICAPLAVAFLVVTLPQSAVAVTGAYTLDTYHTYVHFEVDHIAGISRMRGRFDKVTGKFTLDMAGKTGSLDVIIQTASISTGDNERASRPRARDEHLRSPDFFNVAEFPTMTFKSTKIIFKGDVPGTIEGTVTMLGVTKPVTFNVEHWRCAPHPASKKDMCGANATGTIKRSDFGMKYGIPSVGDEQKLWIEMEGYKD